MTRRAAEPPGDPGDDTGRVRGGRQGDTDGMGLPAEHTTAAAPRGKSGRTRYLRLFPERLDFLLARLTGPQIAAYLRVTVEYVVRDGELSGDDRTLARIARLSPRAWAELRETLAALGIAHAEAGRWIDPDQDASLAIQRATAERQRARALRRWHPRVVA